MKECKHVNIDYGKNIKDDETYCINCLIEEYQVENKKLKTENKHLKKKYISLDTKYYELIMEVDIKFGGLTRHETALKYIKEAETQPNKII